MGTRSPNTTGEVFEPTPWTWIQSLQSRCTSQQAARLLEQLSVRYWPCVYAYLRRSGRDQQTAADITQGFFADVVLGRGLFELADQQIGRFRDLLMQALRRYNIDWMRKQSPADCTVLQLETALPGLESQLRDHHARSPEDEFNRRWASRTLFEAIRRCEAHFQQAGKQQHWQLYQRSILSPSLHGTARPSHRALQEEFEFEKVQQVADAIFAVNGKFRHYLREVVYETVAHDDREVQQEQQYLLSLLSP